MKDTISHQPQGFLLQKNRKKLSQTTKEQESRRISRLNGWLAEVETVHKPGRAGNLRRFALHLLSNREFTIRFQKGVTQ